MGRVFPFRVKSQVAVQVRAACKRESGNHAAPGACRHFCRSDSQAGAEMGNNILYWVRCLR